MCDQPPHVCPGWTDEECLFLNVWTPRADHINEPLPVLVFFHGGAFKDGYAGGLDNGVIYDATAYVNTTNSILVAVNYRVGAMGFLFAGLETGIQGNYGLMDQEMALQWVQNNIAAFGGDPTRVAVAGQSAGAMSIASHLSRPASLGLYSAAIMHSDPFGFPFRDVVAGVDLGTVFAQFAGCYNGSGVVDWTVVEPCLRALNSSQVLEAQLLANKDIAGDITKLLQLFVPWTPTCK
jgi:carboxylesterase type B